MIEIKPGRYFSQWWFLCGNSVDLDVLGALFRDEGETAWHVVYRFRYYNGASRSPFDDKDEKRWWRATIRDRDEEFALKTSNRIFTLLADTAELIMHVVPTRSDDPDKIMEALKQEKWFHSKLADADDAPEGR